MIHIKYLGQNISHGEIAVNISYLLYFLHPFGPQPLIFYSLLSFEKHSSILTQPFLLQLGLEFITFILQIRTWIKKGKETKRKRGMKCLGINFSHFDFKISLENSSCIISQRKAPPLIVLINPLNCRCTFLVFLIYM